MSALSNTEKLRLAVFKLWFGTLAVVVAVYSVRLIIFKGLRPQFPDVFQSFEMMIGLIIPQISIMIAFYFNIEQQRRKIDALSSSQISIIIWLSVAYHAIFILTLIAGIGFNMFDDTPGKPMRGNAAAIAAIMGLFSVFLAPIAFLFSNQGPAHLATAAQNDDVVSSPQPANQGPDI